MFQTIYLLFLLLCFLVFSCLWNLLEKRGFLLVVHPAWFLSPQEWLLWCIWLVPQNLPSCCACGRSNNVEHMLSCLNEAFPIINHNDYWNLTVLKFIMIYPLSLHFNHKVQNSSLNVLLIKMLLLDWTLRLLVFGASTFFIVRILNPYAHRTDSMPTTSMTASSTINMRKGFVRLSTVTVFSTSSEMGATTI